MKTIICAQCEYFYCSQLISPDAGKKGAIKIFRKCGRFVPNGGSIRRRVIPFRKVWDNAIACKSFIPTKRIFCPAWHNWMDSLACWNRQKNFAKYPRAWGKCAKCYEYKKLVLPLILEGYLERPSNKIKRRKSGQKIFAKSKSIRRRKPKKTIRRRHKKGKTIRRRQL